MTLLQTSSFMNERWRGAYLFSNVSSYALDTRQLGRNGSIKNAGGRACFFQSRSLFLQSAIACTLWGKARRGLFTVYFRVSVATRKMVYHHVCIGLLVKALRAHEYFMLGMHQWFVLLPPVITVINHWIFSLKTKCILLSCVLWFCWLNHFQCIATGAVEASIS